MPPAQENNFGNLALSKGYLTPAQLEECLALQREEALTQILPRKIGVILLEKKYLALEQHEELSLAMHQARFPCPLPGLIPERKLTRGKTSTVYLAWDRKGRRWVAVKIQQWEQGGGAARDQFLEAHRLAAELRHLNLVRCYRGGMEQGTAYAVLEYVEGPTLQAYLQSERRVSPTRALRCCLQLAHALSYLHRRNLAHLDLKPENILIASDGVMKLIDLGLARKLGSRLPQQATSRVGTPFYLAPELARPGAAVDARSDLYSLGITLFQLVAGDVPFRGSPPAVLRQHQQAPLPRNSGLFPASVYLLLQGLLAKDPGHRTRSADDFIRETERLLRPPSARARGGTASPDAAPPAPGSAPVPA